MGQYAFFQQSPKLWKLLSTVQMLSTRQQGFQRNFYTTAIIDIIKYTIAAFEERYEGSLLVLTWARHSIVGKVI